jgi:GNAT superfamily N-acetyltransferase
LSLVAEEIRTAEALSDTEKQQLFGWGDDIFGAASLNLSWRPQDLHFLLYADGRAGSHVGILKQVVSVGGQPVLVGGVGSVVTVPGAQKKGCAAQLMREAARFLEQKWRVDAGLLFCLQRTVPFYARLGWQTIEQQVMIEQSAGKIASPLPAMVRPMGRRVWPSGTVELNSLPW